MTGSNSRIVEGRGSPGDPAVKTPCFNVEGMDSVLVQGTKIPHPACCGQKMNKNKNWKIKYVLENRIIEGSEWL